MKRAPIAAVDSGPLVALHHRADHLRSAMDVWLQAQEVSPDFSRFITVDHVVDEVHTTLLRTVGRGHASAFAARLLVDPLIEVAQADPSAVLARASGILPRTRQDTGLTFTDLALVEMMQERGIRHVLSFDRGLASLGVEVVVPGG
ncbi:MAG TPA: PIN domain-containing protein [Candidatus Thermoplasmatota archaeon]|nr:PIN domain-containing protein [Candidatus Thermoplasmatota archaeon]